jgi:hypothetical protein
LCISFASGDVDFMVGVGFVEDAGLGFKVGLDLAAHHPDMVPRCLEATAVVADMVEVGMAAVPVVG